MNRSLFSPLRLIEEQLSLVRKTQKPHHFGPLKTLEELSIIKQAKKEHYPITVSFSGKAFINMDEEILFSAFESGIIDTLVEDTPLLLPFLREALDTFRLTDPTTLNRIKR